MPSATRLIAPRHADRQKKSSPRSKHGILYPLDFFYQQAGVAGPSARRIAPESIPPPYRSLLVHERGMTTTLEQYFGGRIVLRALFSCLKGHWYFRRVLLVEEESGRPVGIGAIRMNLQALDPGMRAQILRNHTPLGRILGNGWANYRSRPKVFLAVKPNSEMMGVFWMPEPRTLYGRQTEVILGRKKIGDVVEILQPALTRKG